MKLELVFIGIIILILVGIFTSEYAEMSRLENSVEYQEGYNDGYMIHNETKYTKCIEYISLEKNPEYMASFGVVGNAKLVKYCKGYKSGYMLQEKETKIIELEIIVNTTN